MSFPETVDEILDVSEDEGGFWAPARRFPVEQGGGANTVSLCFVGVAQLTLGRPQSAHVTAVRH